MNEYLSSSKIRTAKLMSALLIAAFLEVGPASSASLGDSVGGSVGGLGGAVGGAVGGVGNSVGGSVGGATNSVGNTVGGTVSSVGNTVGGVTNSVGNTVNGVPGTIGNTVNGVTTASSPRTIVAQLSSRELILYKKRCVSILRSPQNYDNDMVGICKLIKRKF
jgi:hypothetical protein